jgi:hypothetical protein
LLLYRRVNQTDFILLGSYNLGATLAPGTQLTLTAVGSTIALAENGVAKITVTDTTLTGGSPGIMTYDAAKADNWAGGDATAVPPPQPLQITPTGSANGIDSYSVVSADDGGGTQTLRVLKPTDPTPGVPHNFLYVLPVEPGLGTMYGDGLATLQALGAENTDNLTIIEPSFGVEPWYADDPADANLQYETFMTKDLVPWVTQNLHVTGADEQNWLIGFSKSGFGAQDLLLKHPDLFTAAASWDFPADMNSTTTDGSLVVGNGVNYGTEANFEANYELTSSFVNAHKAPFQTQTRIWIGGFNIFQKDVSDYDALLTAAGIKHTTESPQQLMDHRWDSGWVPLALTGLSQEAAALPPGP